MNAANETVRRAEGDAPYDVVAKVLGDLAREIEVPLCVHDLDRAVDERETVGGKATVDDGAENLNDRANSGHAAGFLRMQIDSGATFRPRSRRVYLWGGVWGLGSRVWGDWVIG